MQRLAQILFVGALLALCWLAMMAVHEAGHVTGAWLTGGRVMRVVLHPLRISRTDVSPNPRPGVVVWSGPIGGAVIPALIFLAMPRRWTVTRRIAQFFAGFCLIANGAYLAVGSFGQVGDCAVLLQTGTPQWVMVVCGGGAALLGLWIWHRLGSLDDFLRDPASVTLRMTGAVVAALVALAITLSVFFGE